MVSAAGFEPAFSCFQNRRINQAFPHTVGGRGGIRTHGGLSPPQVFKTSAFGHSATLPNVPLTMEIREAIKHPTLTCKETD